MESPFSVSAYYLLGLSVSADQLEIKKKARLVSARLGIDDETLESDFSIIKANRTEESLKEALQQLSSPVKKIQQAYLWFSDEDSSELLRLISGSSPEETYEYLVKRAKPINKWGAKRDLAIYLTLLLLHKKGNKRYLKESLDLWKELGSEMAWKYFQRYYQNIDDLNTNESAFISLRKWAEQTISDLYSSLSENWDDPEYTQSYTKVFGKIGSLTAKKILIPLTGAVNTSVTKLISISWQAKEPSKSNLANVKDGIDEIRQALKSLSENGLYNESEIITLRDKAADAIRGVAVDLNNNYDDYERSGKLLEIAEDIAGTESTKIRNQGERGTIEGNQTTQKFMIPILELQNKKKFGEAVTLARKQLHILGKENPGLAKKLEKTVIAVDCRYIIEQHGYGIEKISAGDFATTIKIFTDLRKYIWNEVEQFDFSKESVEELLLGIDSRTKTVDKAKFDDLSNERDALAKDIFEKLGETDSAAVCISLIDCAYYIPLGHYLQKIKSLNQTISVVNTIGWFTIWFYGLGLLAFGLGWYLKEQGVTYVKE